MSTFQVTLSNEGDHELVKKILESLEHRGIVTFQEDEEEAKPASEDNIQQMIEEAELGPYYSEKEARDILDV